MNYVDSSIGAMLGVTLVSVDWLEKGSEEVKFRASDGRVFRMYHKQGCCESVYIEDVIGDVGDLIGSPILLAEEAASDEEPEPEGADSYTWTFYKLATVKGYVTIRWLGLSNGYYSEEVDFEEGRP